MPEINKLLKNLKFTEKDGSKITNYDGFEIIISRSGIFWVYSIKKEDIEILDVSVPEESFEKAIMQAIITIDKIKGSGLV